MSEHQERWEARKAEHDRALAEVKASVRRVSPEDWLKPDREPDHGTAMDAATGILIGALWGIVFWALFLGILLVIFTGWHV